MIMRPALGEASESSIASVRMDRPATLSVLSHRRLSPVMRLERSGRRSLTPAGIACRALLRCIEHTAAEARVDGGLYFLRQRGGGLPPFAALR